MKLARTLAGVLVALVLLVMSACGQSSSPARRSSFATPTGTGYLSRSGPLRILNLQGTYGDMGRQYGALLKNELRALFDQTDAAIGFDRPETQALLQALEGMMEPRERQLLEGMAQETGLALKQHEFLTASLFFMYIGCSACTATGSQTETGYTVAGRNFDNPRGVFSTLLKGQTLAVIYNPRSVSPGSRDNSVALVTELGWVYGLTNLNSKGVCIEYNNGTNSIPVDLAAVAESMDGLHQNLFASLDCNTLEEVHEKLADKAAAATLTQVADKYRVWHYERSPYQESRRIMAGEAKGGDFYYDNPADMDIFTNHFFFTDWLHQIHTDPTTFNLDHDSGSRTLARLVNVQQLARSHAGRINVERMKRIMTTPLQEDGTGGPLIGWELANPDVTIFTTVTDIANGFLHIYPYVDSPQWVAVNVNQEFR